MAYFKMSAPCRLSLFGEHGKTCLTAAIDSRTTLTFEESPDSEHFLITCSQINLSLHIPLEEFRKFYDDCVKYKLELLRERVLQFTDDWYKSDKHKNIVRAFCYLLVHIIYNEELKIKAFNITFSTELLVDEEFVCSASFIVCFTACLLYWSRLQNGSKFYFTLSGLANIRKYASRCKEIGPEYKLANVTVCTLGLMVKYSTEPDTADISYIINIRKLSILLTECNKLKDCILSNQKSLDMLNLSNDIYLNDICSIAQKYEMCGKYTDILSGRYAYILCPLHADLLHTKSISEELKKNNFNITQTNMTRNGVKIEL